MSLSDKKISWKRERQHEYGKIIVIDFIRTMFEKIKNSNYGFYYKKLESNEEFDYIYKYYEKNESIDIEDFEIYKIFIKHKNELVITNDDEYNSKEEENIIFTVNEISGEGMSRCGQCNMNYEGGLCFKGLAYNTGLDEAVPYEGYIKTYYLFRCNCEKERDVNIIDVNNSEDIDFMPCVEIVCNPIINDMNILLLGRCITFNLAYVDIKKLNLH